MVIKFKHRGTMYYLQGKKRREQPSITPYRSKAWVFTDLNKCKPVRDDLLEYFSGSFICS